MSSRTGPSSSGNGSERQALRSSLDAFSDLSGNTQRVNPPQQPLTPSRQQPTTPPTPSPYGNSATRLLETRSMGPSSSIRSRPTISTYRGSGTDPTSPDTAASYDVPTSPPYTAALKRQQPPFQWPAVFSTLADYNPPPTPETDTDSDSDVFNPFSKPAIHLTTSVSQAIHHASHPSSPPILPPRDASPLYAYPASYEHTLLPSGLCLTSPLGSPRTLERGEEADDEESEQAETPSRRAFGSGPDGTDQDHCRVFAKTTTTTTTTTAAFDPFAADDYVPHFDGSAAVSQKGVRESGETNAHVVGDSARRIVGEEVSEERAADEPLKGKFFCGSSRYLLIGGLGADCDMNALKKCIEVKVEVADVIGQFLDPHGLAILVFHDHRAAGFIHQAIQCRVLRLSELQDQVYVRFLHAEEVHRVVGNSIRQRLNQCEARVCITFESSSSLIFPPVEQLKRTLSTFGDLQEFRSIGDSDNSFIAVFCDVRIAPLAVHGLDKKFIGNAQLRLSLTCPLPDEESTLPSFTDLKDERTQGIIDARDLTRHLVQIRASTGFEANVFKTQSWIGVPFPEVDLVDGRPHSLRAPYHSMLQTQEWDKTTLQGSPLETPTKSKRSNLSTRRVEDLFGNPVTPESKKKVKSVAFDLAPEPKTLIEQLNIKFSNLKGPSEADVVNVKEAWVEDEEAVPFRDIPPRQTFTTKSLPVTPTKSLLDREAQPDVAPFSVSHLNRGFDSLHTTPEHVARLGQRARQIEIMKNVPRAMLIDMEALRTGRDPRTSVMIKDIPNKLSRRQLIDCIQEIVPGEIDFAYLRFDFANECNVAYAFVNFTSVSALYRFAKARLGRRWNVFQSEKVLQMTYAKIQGKDAFIQHFINSPVMQCVEAWRPVLLNERGETVRQ
ncbi:hypothetical protein NliqN6_1412 [Naganishia liquefaciens]|uniref:Mei2-like C-terminal RNA recognition motif domain-containing protein n=1 Tax=Naganishia liquefaciens TaxID=104408 RepID=A0A8H3TPV3_9TREE|nr:hypothetical protein NliqN6_1412 [Naganishia liquefaciens]